MLLGSSAANSITTRSRCTFRIPAHTDLRRQPVRGGVARSKRTFRCLRSSRRKLADVAAQMPQMPPGPPPGAQPGRPVTQPSGTSTQERHINQNPAAQRVKNLANAPRERTLRQTPRHSRVDRRKKDGSAKFARFAAHGRNSGATDDGVAPHKHGPLPRTQTLRLNVAYYTLTASPDLTTPGKGSDLENGHFRHGGVVIPPQRSVQANRRPDQPCEHDVRAQAPHSAAMSCLRPPAETSRSWGRPPASLRRPLTKETPEMGPCASQSKRQTSATATTRKSPARRHSLLVVTPPCAPQDSAPR